MFNQSINFLNFEVDPNLQGLNILCLRVLFLEDFNRPIHSIFYPIGLKFSVPLGDPKSETVYPLRISEIVSNQPKSGGLQTFWIEFDSNFCPKILRPRPRSKKYSAAPNFEKIQGLDLGYLALYLYGERSCGEISPKQTPLEGLGMT